MARTYFSDTYYQSIDAAVPAMERLKRALEPLYPGKQLTFGLGKAGRGYASYHAVLNGITYGRITFLNGEIYNIKHYKPFGYEFDPKDPGEFLFLRIHTFFHTGFVLSYRSVTDLVTRAAKTREERLVAARLYRETNPIPVKFRDDGTRVNRHRKALKGPSIRGLIINMLRENDFDRGLIDI
jgi:hypothetical protein